MNTIERRHFRRDGRCCARAALSASPGSRRAQLVPPALAAGRTLTIADVGVGDPGGDWSRFEQPTGNQVNLVSIGNAPSAVVNQLLAGGGQAFDVINIVGGMQKPLVDNDLILELDTAGCPTGRRTPTSSSISRRHARLPVHRLRGAHLRRADRAAGRFLRLSARRRPAISTPTPRCSIPGSRASSRSRTTTPPPARRPRCS